MHRNIFVIDYKHGKNVLKPLQHPVLLQPLLQLVWLRGRRG